MAATPSTMLPLGTPLPDFRLTDARTGGEVSSTGGAGAPATLVMVICNHCPFVKHVAAELARLGDDYQPKGVRVLAVSSNDTQKFPQDGPAAMKETAEQEGWNFPYLFDETQDVARSLRAACTPDFFLFDGERRLAYRGQLDGARPGNDVPVDGRHLRAAIDAVLAGETPDGEQRPSLGCNVKWKPGNEPEWFPAS